MTHPSVQKALETEFKESGVKVKKNEISEIAAVIGTFLDVEPEGGETPDFFELVLLREDSGQLAGESIKFRNISFELRDMLEVSIEAAFLAKELAEHSWLAPLGFLLLWRRIRGMATIKLGEDTSIVLLALSRAKLTPVDLNSISNETRVLCTQYARDPLTTESIQDALEALSALKCVEYLPTLQAWTLIETVRFS